MPTRNFKTWPTTWLPAVEAQIVSVTGLAAAYVFSTLLEDQGEPPPTTQYITLDPGQQIPDEGVIQGAAPETVTPITARMEVVVWSFLDIDVANRDESSLSDATFGSLSLMRKVMKASANGGLQQFDPLDVTTNFYMLAEPMRLASAGFKPKMRKVKTGWGYITSLWEVIYLADLVS
jgi:hypothetical protein